MDAVRIVINNQIGCEGVVMGKYISFFKEQNDFHGAHGGVMNEGC